MEQPPNRWAKLKSPKHSPSQSGFLQNSLALENNLAFNIHVHQSAKRPIGGKTLIYGGMVLGNLSFRWSWSLPTIPCLSCGTHSTHVWVTPSQHNPREPVTVCECVRVCVVQMSQSISPRLCFCRSLSCHCSTPLATSFIFPGLAWLEVPFIHGGTNLFSAVWKLFQEGFPEILYTPNNTLPSWPLKRRPQNKPKELSC